MWPKYFLTTIILLIVACCGLVSTWIFPNELVGTISTKLLIVANLLAIYYLFRFGRLSKSNWRRPFFLLLAIYIIGALAKIQHWPISNVLVSIAFLGIPLLYVFWFSAKRTKDMGDKLKLLWVSVHFPLTWIEFIHLPVNIGSWATVLSSGLLQFTFVYCFMQQKALDKQNRKWDFDND